MTRNLRLVPNPERETFDPSRIVPTMSEWWEIETTLAGDKGAIEAAHDDMVSDARLFSESGPDATPQHASLLSLGKQVVAYSELVHSADANRARQEELDAASETFYDQFVGVRVLERSGPLSEDEELDPIVVQGRLLQTTPLRVHGRITRVWLPERMLRLDVSHVFPGRSAYADIHVVTNTGQPRVSIGKTPTLRRRRRST